MIAPPLQGRWQPRKRLTEELGAPNPSVMLRMTPTHEWRGK
jgi:hypothetical protein